MLNRLLPVACLVLPPLGVAQSTAPFAANGIELLAHLEADSFEPQLIWGGKCWGTTTASGREYALLGGFHGTAIVEVTDPGRPVKVVVIPGVPSGNRSVRVFEEHAYATANAGGGIQVIDLAGLDQGSALLVNTVLAGGLTGTHNLAIDEVSGFIYRLGFESGPGLRIYDLADPVDPIFVGEWDPPEEHPGTSAIHDAQIITYTSGPNIGRQIAFACTTGTTEALSVIDVTDKANAFLLSEALYPNPGLSHQLCLSEDLQWAFLNDEFDEKVAGFPSTTYVFDISDIASPTYVTSFTNGNSAVTHDAFVKGDRLYAANYTSGLRVFDISDPLAAFEVASFDTWPCNDQSTFDSLYSNYPGFASGTVVGGALQNGFFLWRMGAPDLAFEFIGGAPSLLSTTGDTLRFAITESVPGTLVPDSAQLWLETHGTTLALPLVDLGGGTFRAVLPPLPCGVLVRMFVSGRAGDGTTWTEPPAAFTRQERYWATAATSRTVLFADVFESDLGWTTTIPPGPSGQWERVAPDGTPYAPSEDATPGAGTRCWVTDDAPSNCDVLLGEISGGPFVLTSPPIDLTGAIDPRVRYTRWFANNGGTVRDDTLEVQCSATGIEWVDVESVGPNPPETNGGWIPTQFRVLDFVPLSATFRVRYIVVDDPANSISEAGLDDFEVFEAQCGAGTVYCTAKQNSCGNAPEIAFSGTPSATAATGFVVECTNVPEGSIGILIYSSLGQANPPTAFQGGLLCLNTPFKRAGAVFETVGTPGLCDGTFALDMNAVASGAGSSPPAPAMTVVGSRISCQFWGRDTPTVSMVSDALEYVVGP